MSNSCLKFHVFNKAWFNVSGDMIIISELPTQLCQVQLLKTSECQTRTINGRLGSLLVIYQKKSKNLRRNYDFYNNQEKSEVKKVYGVQSQLFLIIANANRISCKFQVDPCHVTKYERPRSNFLNSFSSICGKDENRKLRVNYFRIDKEFKQ